MMAIAPIGGAGVSQLAQLYSQQLTGAVDPGTAARGADFAAAIGQALTQLETYDRTASVKAVQAATGDLTDVHDYVIAATQAQTATELTTTVRNKALDAFNDIMRMPL